MLVVTGLAAEARIAAGMDVVCICAASAALNDGLEAALASSVPSFVLSFGLAGGLAPGLEAGSLIVADGIVSKADDFRTLPASLPSPSRGRDILSCGSEGGDSSEGIFRSHSRSFPCDSNAVATLTERLRDFRPMIVGGLIAGCNAPVMTVLAKAALHSETGAVAVDTESHIAARFAARHGLPFVALRAVCDTAARDLPPLAVSAIGRDGRLDLAAIGRELARRPRQLFQLPGTALATAKAMRSLRRVRRSLGSRLGL